MTRLEEIDAELEQLAAKLCHEEEWPGTCDCGELREHMRRLHRERDSLPIPVPRTP